MKITNTLVSLSLMLLAGCGPALEVEITCTGVRPMVCTCVKWCVSTNELVLVEPTDCEPLCRTPVDAGTP